MRYIAGRHLDTGEHQYEPGDDVPEAADWTRLDAYVNSDHIVLLLEEGDGPLVGVDPHDQFTDEGAAMAKAVGPRWLGASDTRTLVAEPADDAAHHEAKAKAEAVDDDEAPEPAPTAKQAPAPAKRSPQTKRQNQK